MRPRRAGLTVEQRPNLVGATVLGSETMMRRPRMHSLALLLVTVAAGLAVRLVPLGLPAFVVKYGGSTLWALMIYWIVSTLFPTLRLLTAASISGCIATAVEFFKLYHSPGMDAFRLTLPGMLLFGRYFSAWDILAYWIAILFGVLVDRRLRRVER
jgi:hypothetical protein